MFDGKFLCTLTALIVAVVAICNFNPGKNNDPIVENLGMLPSFGPPRTEIIARSNGQNTLLENTFNPTIWNNSTGLASNISQAPGVSSQEFFQTPGNFQSNLSPRFANTQFGSQIRYNAPAFKNMGVPKNPLGYANMAKENYTVNGCRASAPTCGSGKSSQSCRAGGGPPMIEANYANGDYHAVVNKTIENHKSSEGFTDTLPIGNMSTVNNMGEQLDNVIVYNRMMFANRNSRIRSQGDWIRGDLPIVPSNTGWFQVSVDPAIDLNQGAMNVLGGIKNETAGSLAALINNTTGWSTIGGVNMSQQELASVGASGNDVNLTAFP